MDSIIVLLSYFGFVCAGGYLFALKQGRIPWISIIYSFFVLLPVSVGLPLELKSRIACWVAALLLAGVYASRPHWVPAYLYSSRVLSACFATVSFSVFFLSLLNSNAPGWVYLSVPAFLAGLFNLLHVIRKSREGVGL